MDDTVSATGWARSRDIRRGIAAFLGMFGAMAWAMQGLGSCLQSQEGKWQGADYPWVDGTSVDAVSLLTLLGWASLFIAVLLFCGSILSLRDHTSGRWSLLIASGLVVVGQVYAAVLAWIPIDAFAYSTPGHLVFATPLVIFPLLVIICRT